MNKAYTLFLVGIITLVLGACGSDELPPPATTPPRPPVQAPAAALTQKEETPDYVYRGDRYRDPFLSLAGEGTLTPSSDEVTIPSLGALSLKGIFNDGRSTIAVISAGSVSYMLRDGQLYDNRQRIVRGMSGRILKNSVVITAPDRTTKELRLREKANN